jgi:hypothetical protein
LFRIAVALVLVAGLGVLIVRSARDARAKPYAVDRPALTGWRITIESGSSPNAPALLLRAPPELSRDLFHQIFSRAMESLSSPGFDGIPLLLQAELDAAFAGRADPEAFAAVAASVGLTPGPLEPRCLGYRRVSTPSGTRQLYFVLFDAPAFARFREQIATLGDAARFTPAALSPALIIAGSDASYTSWLPIRADPARDCVAPIEIRP